MANSTHEAAMLLGKRKLKHDSETKPILRKHKAETEVKQVTIRKKTVFVDNLPPVTMIPDIIDFFSDVGQVVRVQLFVDDKSEFFPCAFVHFASANQATKARQKKNGECFHRFPIRVDMDLSPPDLKYCFDHKVWNLPPETLLVQEDDARDKTPYFRRKVVFVSNLSPQTKMPDIINVFRYFGKVVGVRLIVNHKGKHTGYCFVEFSSASRVKLALKMNGEYLHDHMIFVHAAKNAPYPPRAKDNLAELLCYDDYLRREVFIKEDEALEGRDATSSLVKAAAIRKKTVFVAHVSSFTKISQIIDFFKDVGEVVYVRLFVGFIGAKHRGIAFVEFASSNEAEKALQKNGEDLDGCEIAVRNNPHDPPGSKYCYDHKVWYEDYLGRAGLLIEDEDDAEEGFDETSSLAEEVAVRKRTIFVHNLSPLAEVKHIIDFFRDYGEVRRIRFIVNQKHEHVVCAFVEFASVKQAKKVLEVKDGRRPRVRGSRGICLNAVEIAPYPLRPKYEEECLLSEKNDTETTWLRMFCGKKTTFSGDD